MPLKEIMSKGILSGNFKSDRAKTVRLTSRGYDQKKR
jgi:hypothetical protein